MSDEEVGTRARANREEGWDGQKMDETQSSAHREYRKGLMKDKG